MDAGWILAGLVVGALVGLTGVGGGAVMTPLLIFNGISPAVAVGTDLVYAALSKLGGSWIHHRRGNVDWRLVAALATGSLPTAVVTIAVLAWLSRQGIDYEGVITHVLGVSLILTALALLFRARWRKRATGDARRSLGPTIAAGIVIGALTTLSSVGAGALGAAALALLHPGLPMVVVVGTDIAHAVLLATLAGAGHWHLGAVDFVLLLPLLCGSLPGLYMGALLATRVPELVLQRLVAAVLLSLGLGFSWS